MELTRLNAEKSLALATALFPLEEWIPHGKGVFIAKNRLLGGHVVYFLPEQFEGKNKGKRRADTVMDGAIVELKTVSGNRTTLGKSFKRGYKQGLSMLETNPKIKAEHDVFLRLYTPFTIESVRAKIAGELKTTSDRGRCIYYFEATEELFYWTYDELRAIVGS
ncbi:MAG: hypothetical protein LBI06_03830 [Treponema sp.]|jgi:hypothetical protein|nr:hypothetical protein [Treponema sp.]